VSEQISPDQISKAEYEYWSQPPDALLASLKSAPTGLSSAEAERRLSEVGLNSVSEKAQSTQWSLFLNQFKSPILLILLFATAISAVLQDWVDAVIIFVIIVGSALLSSYQEWSANAAAAKLRERVTSKASVLRDGQVQAIPSQQVVPGDIVLLSAGSLIPADGVVLEAKDFFVNQAVLTGETFPVEKKTEPVAAQSSLSQRINCVFMGTNVRSGTAKILVVETGKRTAFGKIAQSLVLRPPETDFERGIRRFGYLLSQVMFVLVIFVFAINVAFHEPVLDSLLFSVALAVGLTPQLLPAIISITLSQGSQKMAAQGVIVRRLESIENFGSMDVLCTDKTGTLTEGVVRLDGAVDIQGQPSKQVNYYACINAHFQTGLSNPLDDAILASETPDLSGVTKVDEIPYDFTRKRLSVVVQDHQGFAGSPAGQPLMITKGALDLVLAVCTQVQDGAQISAIDDEQRNQIQKRFAGWGGQGYRVLGVAVKPVSPQSHYGVTDERDFIFIGFLLFFDPPKAGAKETIQQLEELGVRIKIITGDSKLVALHCAETLGLPIDGVLTGSELQTLRDEALWYRVEYTDLFAEVDPNQKESIILALKKRGHVVGYMGDGINDAPPLHAADVGISVDTAVDVAKDAADFVLLEKSLDALRQGIILGRNTFANTLKYVFITTSANFGNMFSVAGASLFLPYLPMLPMQILLTNFLTDLPATTIASDNVDHESVDKPQRWNIHFIRDFMIVFGLISTVFDYLTFFTLLFVLHAGVDQFRTGWFLESTLSELLILLVIRTRNRFYKSRPANSLLVATLVVAAIVLWLPYSPWSHILGFAPLPFSILAIVVVIIIVYGAASEMAKSYFYRWKGRQAGVA
jgi:Mg2+-importing ATPase